MTYNESEDELETGVVVLGITFALCLIGLVVSIALG